MFLIQCIKYLLGKDNNELMELNLLNSYDIGFSGKKCYKPIYFDQGFSLWYCIIFDNLAVELAVLYDFFVYSSICI